MTKGNPRLGKCLCGAEGTIRDTRAEDGRLHFTCRELTPEGRAKHFGFVDQSEAMRLEDGPRVSGEEDWRDGLDLED